MRRIFRESLTTIIIRFVSARSYTEQVRVVVVQLNLRKADLPLEIQLIGNASWKRPTHTANWSRRKHLIKGEHLRSKKELGTSELLQIRGDYKI
jgi:hypothetical protein